MDGTNWYAYCAGDPVNFVDSWGLEITAKDIEAYESGKMSDFEWNLLNEANEEWNAAREDDYTAKAMAHSKAFAAREGYMRNSVDDFDYTFGTAYSAKDNGGTGKFMQTVCAYSSDNNVYGMSIIYYERYQIYGKDYLKIYAASGHSGGNLVSDGIDVQFGSVQVVPKPQSTVYKKEYSTENYVLYVNDYPIADDHAYTNILGVNTDFHFIKDGKRITISTVNQLYNCYYTNEKGDDILEPTTPTNILDGRDKYSSGR